MEPEAVLAIVHVQSDSDIHKLLAFEVDTNAAPAALVNGLKGDHAPGGAPRQAVLDLFKKPLPAGVKPCAVMGTDAWWYWGSHAMRLPPCQGPRDVWLVNIIDY